jgi:hypothetical protein
VESPPPVQRNKQSEERISPRRRKVDSESSYDTKQRQQRSDPMRRRDSGSPYRERRPDIRDNRENRSHRTTFFSDGYYPMVFFIVGFLSFRARR